VGGEKIRKRTGDKGQKVTDGEEGRFVLKGKKQKFKITCLSQGENEVKKGMRGENTRTPVLWRIEIYFSLRCGEGVRFF
jgi:hypothetical protein